MITAHEGKASLLADRGLVRIAGEDAVSFLQGLVTNDVAGLANGAACYAALLTPQGKILFDFLAIRSASDILLDCPLSLAPDIAKRLGFYRLRARVTVADQSALYRVLAVWDSADASATAAGVAVVVRDPRHEALGWRVIREMGPWSADAPHEDYEAHRIALGVPQGGVDFTYGDTFPHEANLDRLHGLDFRKGCYVGQEVVSRVEHRGLARKRVAGIRFEAPAPARGTEIVAGDTPVGTMGSSSGSQGLAMLRLDRVTEAAAQEQALMAGRVAITVV